MSRYRRTRHVFGAVMALIVLAGSELHAQAGAVSGRVTDAGTRQPVAGAQISITGSQRGSVTGADGAYLIPGVPAGLREIRVQHISYGTVSQQVQVTADGTATANFELESAILNLGEIVVTGVAGQSTRATLPFSVERVTAAAMPVPAQNAAALLIGRVAGVQVTAPSGRPGATPDILLRGPTSINANGRSQSPLFIVDGVVLTGSVVDIDGLDVESIEIVKGAAAASLYGSRAANGVIQITTKRGRDVANDQVRYTVRTEYGRNELPGRFNITTKHHYETTADGRFVNAQGAACDFTQCPSLRWAGQRRVGDAPVNAWNTIQQEAWPGRTYDHIGRFFNGGDYVSTNVSAAGRSGATNYFVGYTRQDIEGVLTNSDGLLQHNFRLNVDQSVRSNVTLSASAAYTLSEQDARDGGSGSMLFALTRMPAGVDLLMEDPSSPGNVILKPDPSFDNMNPMNVVLNQRNDLHRSRYLGALNARWTPIQPLSFEGSVAFDRLDWDQHLLSPKGFRTLGQPGGTGGALQRIADVTEGMNASVTAQYRHSIGALQTVTSARYLIEREDYTRTNTSGSNFVADDVWTFTNIPNATISATSLTQNVRADGFFVSTNLIYDDRYILDLLVRQDGSSLFGPDSRRRWYQRGSAAWRIGEEPWFNVPSVDELKLRYSVGTAGNTPRWEAQYETYSVGAGSIAPVTLGNRNLRPEHATEHEAGIEAVIANRFSVDLTYARSRVEDQILNVPQLGIRGFERQWQNAGTLQSSTFEATLGAQLLRTENFTWNTRLMFDRTRQHISELNVPAYRDGVLGQNLGNVFYIREGEAIGSFYGFQFATGCDHLPQGVDCSQFEVNDDGYLVWVGAAGSSANGWQTYTDAGGNTRNWWGTESPIRIRGNAIMWGTPFQAEDFDPRTGQRGTFLPLGGTQPDFRVALANTVGWRNFTLFGSIESVQGFKVYNQPLQWATFQNYAGFVDQSGKPEADRKPVGYYQAVYGASGLQPSSAFVQDGSYTKLRELSLRFDAGEEILRRVPGFSAFGGFALTVTGRNLLTWTNYDGYDPDVGSSGGGTGSASIARIDGFSYPNFRTVTFGAEINF
jgi:TonB-linked SusC/RagA family outer membrane protein